MTANLNVPSEHQKGCSAVRHLRQGRSSLHTTSCFHGLRCGNKALECGMTAQRIVRKKLTFWTLGAQKLPCSAGKFPNSRPQWKGRSRQSRGESPLPCHGVSRRAPQGALRPLLVKIPNGRHFRWMGWWWNSPLLAQVSAPLPEPLVIGVRGRRHQRRIYGWQASQILRCKPTSFSSAKAVEGFGWIQNILMPTDADGVPPAGWLGCLGKVVISALGGDIGSRRAPTLWPPLGLGTPGKGPH